MGLPVGEQVIRLLKSVDGLTTAPLEWYSQVDKVLKELGVQAAADPCVWIFVHHQGEHIGVIGAHVDDFLISGAVCPEWEQKIAILMQAFRWTPWEKERFKQCGVVIEQSEDGSIMQHQEIYLAGVSEIGNGERALTIKSPVGRTTVGSNPDMCPCHGRCQPAPELRDSCYS